MLRLPENIIKFAAESGIDVNLYKKFRDYYNHYRSVQYKANVDYDNSISFEEKTEKMHSLILETVNKISGVKEGFAESILQTNPNYRWATFATINSLIDSVLAETIVSDFDQFAEVKYGGWGDTFTFDTDTSDLFIISKMSNGKRRGFGQRQYKSQTSLIPENRVITVEEDWYRILCGKRNLAEYTLKVILAFEEQMSLDIYNAINDTYSTLGANFKAAAYTQSGFVQLAERISACNAGANTIVFGTKTALSNVLPTNDYLKMGLGQEYKTVGYLRDFMNVDLMPLKQKVEWQSGSYDFVLDNTRLYFISTNVQKLVKVAIEGNTLTFSDTASNTANLVESQTLQKRWAVGVVTNAKYGIMDMS
jgi:hypothetical protein